MKSQTVSSTATSRSYRASAGGELPKGSPTPPVKPLGINHFDFSGEPQELSDDTNLSTPRGSENTSQTNSKSDPSQQQFGSRSSVDDGSRDADSASEDSDFVTPPANTPPGPAQPTVQLSDDPAIAALQKSTLAATTQVVLYAQCRAILDNALADPQCKLPPNSFSNLRGLFGGAIKECEGRAQELTTQTEQLLAQHSEDAKALAAQADGDALPAADDTFSVRPNRAPVDTRRALREVKQLPKQAQQDQILKGLRVARKNIGHESDADVDREVEQQRWDLNNPTLVGVDPELGELYKQLQTEKTEPAKANFDNELEVRKQLGEDPDKLQNSAAPAKKSAPKLDDELLALLAELDNQPTPVPTQPKSHQPNKTPLNTSAQLQELIQNHSTLTADELQDVANETKAFQDKLAHEEARPLTQHEKTERVLYENQGRFYRQYLKNKLIDDYVAEQRTIIRESEQEITFLLANQDQLGQAEKTREDQINALLGARRVAVNMALTVGRLKA